MRSAMAELRTGHRPRMIYTDQRPISQTPYRRLLEPVNSHGDKQPANSGGNTRSEPIRSDSPNKPADDSTSLERDGGPPEKQNGINPGPSQNRDQTEPRPKTSTPDNSGVQSQGLDEPAGRQIESKIDTITTDMEHRTSQGKRSLDLCEFKAPPPPKKGFNTKNFKGKGIETSNKFDVLSDDGGLAASNASSSSSSSIEDVEPMTPNKRSRDSPSDISEGPRKKTFLASTSAGDLDSTLTVLTSLLEENTERNTDTDKRSPAQSAEKGDGKSVNRKDHQRCGSAPPKSRNNNSRQNSAKPTARSSTPDVIDLTMESRFDFEPDEKECFHLVHDLRGAKITRDRFPVLLYKSTRILVLGDSNAREWPKIPENWEILAMSGFSLTSLEKCIEKWIIPADVTEVIIALGMNDRGHSADHLTRTIIALKEILDRTTRFRTHFLQVPQMPNFSANESKSIAHLNKAAHDTWGNHFIVGPQNVDVTPARSRDTAHYSIFTGRLVAGAMIRHMQHLNRRQ